MQLLSEFWSDTLKIPEARWIFFGTILICAVLIAIYFSFFFRNLATGKKDRDPLELLTRFRELRDRGRLDETEYAKLKQAIHGSGNPIHPDSDHRDVLDENQNNKTFLTLAEAESLKRSRADQQGSDENSQAEDSQ